MKLDSDLVARPVGVEIGVKDPGFLFLLKFMEAR